MFATLRRNKDNVFNTERSEKKSDVTVQKFSKRARGCAYIEVIRIISLVALIVGHSIHISSNTDLSIFTRGTIRFSTLFLNVYAFATVTGIYISGRGKDYFLRNLSRQIFVIILVIAIGLVVYFSTNHHTFATGEGTTIGSLIGGGRDIGYLGGITFVAIFLPFIKIEKVVSKHLIISFFISIILLSGQFLEITGGLSFIKIFGGTFGSYTLLIVFTKGNYSRKKIIGWSVSIVLVIASIYCSIFLIAGWASPYAGAFLIIIISTYKTSTPRGLNIIVKNAYFIYELHFLFQIVWINIMKDKLNGIDINGAPHFADDLQMGIAFIFVLVCSSVASVAVTFIQTIFGEKVIANNTLYKITPFTKKYSFLIIVYIVFYGVYMAGKFIQG